MLLVVVLIICVRVLIDYYHFSCSLQKPTLLVYFANIVVMLFISSCKYYHFSCSLQYVQSIPISNYKPQVSCKELQSFYSAICTLPNIYL